MKSIFLLTLLSSMPVAGSLPHCAAVVKLARNCAQEDPIDRSCICPPTSANFCNACVRDALSAGSLTICNTTDSTSCTTGAAIIAGGVGAGGNLNVCGYVNTNQNYRKNSLIILDGNLALENLSVGFDAGLVSNGGSNTFVGTNAGTNNTGSSNIAVGNFALNSNTTGSNNSALGATALFSNTIGSDNAAVGFGALASNTSGSANTAHGFFSLNQNRTGNDNTATGFLSMGATTTGLSNSAFGAGSLLTNVNGNDNIGIGVNAGQGIVNGSDNTFVGTGSNANGDYSSCIVIGSGAQATASGQLVIGSTTHAVGNLQTTATAGANPVPADAQFFLNVTINGTPYKIALFNP